MDKPIELTPKLVKVEAMQYNGENSDAIAKWVLAADPMAICQQRTHIPSVLPWHHLDGSDRLRMSGIQYLFVKCFYGGEIHIFVGDWLFKEREHRFSKHRHGEVRSKYDIPGFTWPEPHISTPPAL